MAAMAVFAVALGLAFLEIRGRAYCAEPQWRRELKASIAFGVIAMLLKTVTAVDVPPLQLSGVTLALFAAVFVIDDFLYYAAHRLAHRVGIFWASHTVHHSSTRYNFFMGLRQPPTWMFTPAAAAPVLLIFAGAPIALVAASGAVRALHHFLLHTERVRRLPGWIEYVFNTPSHHRVHHSSMPDMLDRNFGGVLIVWDRLFGTFAPEPSAGVGRYGVVGGGSPTSIVEVAAEPWRKLARRIGAERTAHRKLAAALAPPAPAASSP